MEVDLQRGGRGGAYAPPQQASHRDWLAGSLVFAGEAFEAGDSSDVGGAFIAPPPRSAYIQGRPTPPTAGSKSGSQCPFRMSFPPPTDSPSEVADFEIHDVVLANTIM